MQIHKKTNLKPFHTFSIDTTCEVLVIVDTLEELISVYQNTEWVALPKLILGKGSNVLFTEHFNGVVIINRLLGIEVVETENEWLLDVKAGEDWPNLVQWSLDRDYLGLENLALIPGCAGSAPIQNIGAYGVEFKDVCDYVEIVDLNTLVVSRLSNTECEFGYRDSIFKKEVYGNVVIIAIGLRLPKQWKPIVSYGSLKTIAQNELTAKHIFDEICATRMSKLPDPAQLGNAGSFFKNPIISHLQFNELKVRFPDIVAYSSDQGMKVAAGWLIDQSGLKGLRIGGAMVHQEQALVLVNSNKATSDDIINLAKKVCSTVFEKYQISLEHEVRFFDSKQETSLHEMARD